MAGPFHVEVQLIGGSDRWDGAVDRKGAIVQLLPHDDDDDDNIGFCGGKSEDQVDSSTYLRVFKIGGRGMVHG